MTTRNDEKIVQNLEDAIMLDFAFWKNLTTNLQTTEKSDDFCHTYNPVHVYCRMVELYNIPQIEAFNYIKSRYEPSYNMKCGYKK
jgi:hypothetical protein